MTEINTDCPVCEKEISISARDIKLAISHRKETNGKILVSCPECCRALVLESEQIGEDQTIDEWIGTIAENPDWCGCVPMLDSTQERIPNGSYADLGVTFYRPGGGGKPMKKRQYMATYGINPECHMKKNPGVGGKPFQIGD